MAGYQREYSPMEDPSLAYRRPLPVPPTSPGPKQQPQPSTNRPMAEPTIEELYAAIENDMQAIQQQQTSNYQPSPPPPPHLANPYDDQPASPSLFPQAQPYGVDPRNAYRNMEQESGPSSSSVGGGSFRGYGEASLAMPGPSSSPWEQQGQMSNEAGGRGRSSSSATATSNNTSGSGHTLHITSGTPGIENGVGVGDEYVNRSAGGAGGDGYRGGAWPVQTGAYGSQQQQDQRPQPPPSWSSTGGSRLMHTQTVAGRYSGGGGPGKGSLDAQQLGFSRNNTTTGKGTGLGANYRPLPQPPSPAPSGTGRVGLPPRPGTAPTHTPFGAAAAPAGRSGVGGREDYFDSASYRSGFAGSGGGAGMDGRSPTIVHTPSFDERPGTGSSLSRNVSANSNYGGAGNGTGSPIQSPGLQHSSSLSPHSSLNATSTALLKDPDLQYVNPALMSNLASWLKTKIPRVQKIKGTIEYPRSFTGRDIVNTLLPALPVRYRDNRRMALMVARSIQDHPLFFHEVDWEERRIKDNNEDVFMFREDDNFELNEPGFGGSSASMTGGGAAGGAGGSGGFVGGFAVGGEVGGSGTGDDMLMEELPAAVITSLTRCYSFSCSGKPGEGYACYSMTCPSRKSQGDLQRSSSVLSTATTAGSEASDTSASSWEFTVPPEFLKTLEKNTIIRQCAIYELIHQEENLARDLRIFRDVIRGALITADPPIIPRERLQQFIQDVFLNMDEVVEKCDQFLEALKVRQREEHPLVRNIGDVILSHALDWHPVYLKYNVSVPMAEQRVKEEISRNPAFAAFVSGLSKLTNSKQADFRHYQTRLSFRMPRYDLQLSEAIKRSEDDDPDKGLLEQAREVIKKQCQDMNTLMKETELKVALREYAVSIMRKDDEDLGLDLFNPERHICHFGDIVRKTDAALSEWVDLHAILFDHWLIMTKPRVVEGKRRHFVSRSFPPCRLELLAVRDRDEEPTKRAGIGIGTLTGAFSTSDGRNAAQSRGETQEKTVYPLILDYGNRNDTPPFSIYLSSEAARSLWRKKINEAIKKRMDYLSKHEVLDLRVMTEAEMSTATNSGLTKPACSVPFHSPDRGPLLALGTNEGVWIGHPGQVRTFHRVLHLPDIRQVAVLQQFNLFVVLAQKLLFAYRLDELVPPKDGRTSKAGAQQISNKEITFFKVGKTHSNDGVRTLLVFAKSGVSQTIFKSLEPLKATDRAKGGKGLLSGFKQQEYFRTYKEWFVPSEGTTISFLRKMVAMSLAKKGIEIIKIDDLRQPASIPDFDQPALRNDPHAQYLRSRISDSSALGMFRLSSTEFLLCYTELAFFTDTHGDPISRRSPAGRASSRLTHVLDYEARSDQVAYHAPYLIVVSTNLVQVFDVRTAQSVQLIRGLDIAMLYDGLSIDADGGLTPPENRPERRIHICMRKKRDGQIGSNAWYYQILEMGTKGLAFR